MMNKAYSKDIWRTVRREKKRFGSLLLITALGVTMLSGLRAACSDLRHTADAFYDGQNLYDISIVSTMGLTAEDVEALQNMKGIEQAEGAYSEVVQVTLENADGLDSQVHQNKTAQIKTLSSSNLNLPYIIEGCLPEKVDEIAVSENYLTQSGKKIGDTLVINEELEEDEEPNFLQTEYKITGSIVDPMDVDSHEGVMSFRSTTAAEYTFYVMPGAVESDVYTTIYLTVKNAKDELCYSDAYKELIEKQITAIDTEVKDKRQQARYDKLTGDASKELVDAEAEADAEFDKAQQDINEAKVKLSESRQQLEAAAAFLPTEELAVQQSALEEAQKELQENEQKLVEEMAKARQQFDDARADIEAIEMPQWYIQDRSALSGYMNVQSDADCIEAVGTAFPILFLVVAILISLTTITRMVEEERGLIGTYKALGFTDREIRRKYLLYAAIACILGGVLGDVCGFVVLPAIIFRIFGIMYQLPWYLYGFDMLYGLGGIALFAVGIIGATWISCEAELKHTPASLMRPKAPKSGARIFLERWKFVWGRLSFLNKVTARNLFRYKKRMLMTIGGIMGCTALVLCGFVIKNPDYFTFGKHLQLFCIHLIDHTFLSYNPFVISFSIFFKSVILSRSSAAASKFKSAAALRIFFSTVAINFFNSFSSIDSGSFAKVCSSLATALDILIRSLTAFLIVCGVILCSSLYFCWIARLLAVSSRVIRMESVMVSAYMITCPSAFLAARPTVWIRDVAERKKPSLSASRIATSDISGISKPSLSRLIPTSTSKTSSRMSRIICARSRVSISECRYFTRIPTSLIYFVRSSAIRFVSVVTRTLLCLFVSFLIWEIRSSICPSTG